MSIEIPLSQLRANGFADHDTFQAAVDEYIAAREAHSKTIGEARPATHPLVESVVVRYPPPPDLMPDEHPEERFVAEYEFKDDTPPPPPPPAPPTLAERKQMLAQQVSSMAMAAADTVWPILTRRLPQLKARAAAAVPEADRSPEQVQALADLAAKVKELDAINMHLAELELQINDLTDETIDAWQPGSFPV